MKPGPVIHDYHPEEGSPGCFLATLLGIIGTITATLVLLAMRAAGIGG